MKNWKVQETMLTGFGFEVINQDSQEICRAKTKEDAQLIAAAPELLEALILANSHINFDKHSESAKIIKQAINKALGK